MQLFKRALDSKNAADSKGGYVKQNTCDFLIAKQLVAGLNARQCTKK